MIVVLLKAAKVWWVFTICYSLINIGYNTYISKYSLIVKWGLYGLLAIFMLYWDNELEKHWKL